MLRLHEVKEDLHLLHHLLLVFQNRRTGKTNWRPSFIWILRSVSIKDTESTSEITFSNRSSYWALTLISFFLDISRWWMNGQIRIFIGSNYVTPSLYMMAIVPEHYVTYPQRLPHCISLKGWSTVQWGTTPFHPIFFHC